MRRATRLLLLPAVLLTLADPVAFAGQTGGTMAAPHGVDLVSVRWNRLVPSFAEAAAVNRQASRRAAAGDSAALRRIAQSPPPPMLFRVYTLLGVAQYAAASAARDDRTVSSEAAIASASATVLTEQFADSGVRASIAAELAHDIDHVRSGAHGAALATAGQRLGEDVASRTMAWAPPATNLAGPWNGTVPTGRGMWFSARGIPPIGIMLMQSRGWLLDSASQYRPGPPPAYGTAAFDASIEEVRRVARERTPEQTRIAQRWNSADPWARWNEVAVDALRRHHASNDEAARVLAVLNVAASDAVIACFEAKYHYWSIRPSQADTSIALADSVNLPNFPSYPSGHACSAGAFDAVLGHYFPRERAEFTRIAEEQAMSRLYGGIHYRVDNDAGLALGRAVARHAIERERRGGLNAWRTARAEEKH